MNDSAPKDERLIERLQAISRNGNGMFGEVCGQAAAALLRKDAEIKQLQSRIEAMVHGGDCK